MAFAFSSYPTSISAGYCSIFLTIALNARPVELNVIIGAPERTNEKSKLYKSMSPLCVSCFCMNHYITPARRTQQKR